MRHEKDILYQNSLRKSSEEPNIFKVMISSSKHNEGE
jgi:hypothetical protein